MRMSMLRFIRKSVLVQRESWRMLHRLRQSSGAVEMESRGPLQSTIESKLLCALKPSHLEVINESYMHSVPKSEHNRTARESSSYSSLGLLNLGKRVSLYNESHTQTPKNCFGDLDSETHFKVVVVSETFEGMSLLKRHRLVMDTLKEEMEKEGGVHALSIQARTPQQWDASGGKVVKSPPCLGGSRETAADKTHEGSEMNSTFHNATDTR